MGKKDITLKDYLSDPMRYADLLNGSIFQGRQVIQAETLQDMDTVQSKSDKQTVVERINDIVMKQTQTGNLFAVWVVANQDTIDYSMPVRVMVQDALAYDQQIKNIKRMNQRQKQNYTDSGEFLSKIRKEDHIQPVITLVVYWGEEKWHGAKSLHDMIDFGKDKALAGELKRLVPEYPLHFLNLSEVHDYKNFQTELRTLFELYDRRNDKIQFHKYLDEHEECRQLDTETFWTLSILLDEKKLDKQLQNSMSQKEEVKIDMCKAIRELIADGKTEGRAEGILQGRLSALYELVQDGLLSVKDAAIKASMTENNFSIEMKKAGY